ncbi:ubiquinol-cytochrome-c reductase complex subunit-domain-containing protein [Schizothecium vesticola]|uniref:Ubiquinol-cytochrome-c reductase complex subunit-domain-containing protein n=1 Tax=Schizothecium vesticola TaxID=314040 RepID=A0AA40ERD2_9PEZI|nr:ubiquinol-cytochrome-c reductase complex subunit-domain-containing protein [Schizothecium vesticola]
MPFLSAWAPKPNYTTYKSPYGPKYHNQPHFGGITSKSLFRVAPTLAGFGGVALFTVIFYASGIPRLQDDVLKRIPILRNASAYDRSVPASDSPF